MLRCLDLCREGVRLPQECTGSREDVVHVGGMVWGVGGWVEVGMKEDSG